MFYVTLTQFFTCTRVAVVDLDVVASLEQLHGLPLDVLSSTGSAMRRSARWPQQQLSSSARGRELAHVSCTRHEARVGVPFTVSIFNICRAVMWPLSRVLVLMMGMCKRLCSMVSDSLCVTLVACVPHTSRGSFACTRAACTRHTVTTDQADLWW